MNIKRVLQRMVEMGASDLHVKVGTKPTARVNGELVPIDEPPPTQAELETVVNRSSRRSRSAYSRRRKRSTSRSA